MIDFFLKYVKREDYKIKESLMLKQNTAVQPNTLELLISKHYINNININKLRFNLFLIKAMLPEINIFKNLYNIYNNNKRFDIRKTEYYNLEDVVKIRDILKKMNIINDRKSKSFLKGIIFYHMEDLLDCDNILNEFLSLSPESIFLNRTVFENKSGNVKNINLTDDKEYIIKYWLEINCIYLNFVFSHLVENTKVFEILVLFESYNN